MIWIAIIVLAIALDQATKMIIISNMDLSDSIKIIDNFLYITYWENKGAAWGILQDQRWLFIILTTIMIIVLAIYLRKINNNLARVSLSLIIGGALGNYIDRVFRGGSVVDFINVYIGGLKGYDFPVFNIADSCVCVGTVLLSIYILFFYGKAEKQEAEDKNQADVTLDIVE